MANELRGAVDGWEFKQYVLDMLFYRFISENITKYINKLNHDAGVDEDYAAMEDSIIGEEDKAEIVKEKGFFIYPSELFCNVQKKAKNNPNINETLQKVFDNIENSAKGTASETDMKGLFDDIDVNSDRLGLTVEDRNKRLCNILEDIASFNLDYDYENAQIDIFGDAYEYLMNMYASGAGKSGGEFFTPQEVSELLALIISFGKEFLNKVYDPACGSGSLLIKIRKLKGKDFVRKGFYGQEINPSTYNLCRINMFLHNINYEKFDIRLGDTLKNPLQLEDGPFDGIVSNPPYSIKWEGDSNPLLINDPRFSPAGVLAPKTKADLAFTMHMLYNLAPDGTAAIVEFPGVLYRGGAEQKIRKYLVDNNYIDTVIQLPANLFFGVGIAVCIIVLKKNKTENKTLFIDASNEFEKYGNKNRLTPDNIKHIMDAYGTHEDKKHVASLVDNTAIEENDYNLSVSSYVEPEDTREVVDINALNQEIDEIVEQGNELRNNIKAIVAELEGGNV
jgi:type I restriction enzyme M protein